MKRELMLLIDCVGYAEMSLNEGSNNDGMTFSGKFQEANGVNKNRRKYTKAALDRNMKQLQEAIKNGGLYGELDHRENSIVHLSNASHIITKLWWEGNDLMGEGRFLPTPAGKILKAIAETGCRWGISSRGVGNGTTDSEGILVIDESYKLITWDAVADPSTPGAYPNASYKKKLVKTEEYVQQEAEHKVDLVETKNEIKWNSDLLETVVQAATNKFVEKFKRK